ncbi:MAG: ROK family protein, partial [Steroidobacteraceae bacterium]
MSGGSRRRTRARDRQRCVLCIDVGGTNIRAGLFLPQSGSIRHFRAISTDASNGGREALARAAAIAREVVEAGNEVGLSVHEVGIGVPELVGPAGRIESRAVLPWRSRRVRQAFAAYGAVTIVSDVRAAALAEARLGAARGSPTFLYVGVGTGISSTLFIDGRPWLGAQGHAIAFASGPTCLAVARNGKAVFAPLESRASGPALVRRAKALGFPAKDAADVCRAARARPGIARGVVDAAATELAAHVAILVNALDPSLVVLGGGLGSAPGRYWNSFRAALPRFAWGRSARRVRVRRARLGARGGMIGAALSTVEASTVW